MRSRTAIWFECKIQYEKTMEDGLQKKVTESYTVDALSFTELRNASWRKCPHTSVASLLSKTSK